MDNKKIKFNLSPSAIKVYNKCQLQFYYMYITKESPDSKVYTCYGNGGTVVHKVLEDYVNSLLENKPMDDLIIYSEFDSLWKKYKLDSEVGKNNQPLCREEYQTAVKNGIEFLKNYKPIATEETISFPLENSDIADIGIKGIIDLQAYNDNNEHCIIDWKTSSSVDDDFRIQATHYAYSVYKKHGIIPKVYFIYLKLKKKDSAHVSKYNITLDDINDYEKMLVSLKDEILEKGWDISKYDLGNIYDTFNVHKNKCYKESLLRNNKDNILYNINNNEIEFLNLTDNLRVAIDKKFKYFIKGAIYSDLYTKHIWDGMVHLFKKDKLPLGLLSMLSEYVVDFNKYFNTEYKLVLVNDMRNQLVVEHKYKTQFKDNDILLRDYQNQAIDHAIEKKHGILYMGTGAGKTIVSAEIIKRLNVRTLFLINRVELVDQTAEVFEDYFGISVGKMIDGELDIVNQITVASIQTINAILQRKDEDSKRLSTYLYNVNCVIYDECQTVKDEGMYELLSKELVNATYIFGLSGSPFRADEHTLKMNALVGSVIYSKSTKELEDMGYLVPTTVYFIESITSPNTTNYSSAYNSVIVNNPARNEIISNIVNKNRNKKILIITKLIEHGKILQKIIPNSFLITSETPKTERKENFKTFKENNGYVLIGSSQIFSAGIDIPDLDIIINVSAHKSDVQSVQTIGRVKRKTENKVMGYYIDFYDIGAKFFKDSAKQRMEILKQFGNNIQIVKDYNEIII